jgi:hypothetical protein
VAGAVAHNPSTVVQSVFQSLPAMGAGGVVGRGVLAVAPRLGAIASGIGEGAVTIGQQAEQIRGDDLNTDRLLTGSQAAIAAGTGALTGAIGAFSNKLAHSLGFETAENLMTGVKAAGIKAQAALVKKVVGGAVPRASSRSFRRACRSRSARTSPPAARGDYQVDQQAVLGTLSGAVMGAGANIRSSPVDALDHTPPAQKAAADKAMADIGSATTGEEALAPSRPRRRCRSRRRRPARRSTLPARSRA